MPSITTLIFCMILTILCIIHNMYYATIECKRIWSLDKVLIPSRRTQAPRKHTQQYNERSEQKTDGKKLGCVCTPNIFSIIRSTMFGEREEKRNTILTIVYFFPCLLLHSQDRPAGTQAPSLKLLLHFNENKKSLDDKIFFSIKKTLIYS